jgi:hypothetical protein
MQSITIFYNNQVELNQEDFYTKNKNKNKNQDVIIVTMSLIHAMQGSFRECLGGAVT